MNIVDELLTHSFSARTYAEKKEIVTAGRPKPRLSELTEVTKQCTRRFRETIYTRNWTGLLEAS